MIINASPWLEPAQDMSPSSRMSPPSTPQNVVNKSVMVRQRIKQANCPLPNLEWNNFDSQSLQIFSSHLVLLNRMTGAADRLVIRARQRRRESARMFCCDPCHTEDMFSRSESSRYSSSTSSVSIILCAEDNTTSSPCIMDILTCPYSHQ